MVCTFFGHRDAPQTIKSSLRLVLSDLIENKNVNMFYVGNNGSFDSMVRSLLKEFKKTHNIHYYVALAYIPPNKDGNDYSDSIYFDELSLKPFRIRIAERNKLMVEKSDIVVTYVTHITRGAYKLKLFAAKKGKTVIDLSPNEKKTPFLQNIFP